MRSHTMRYVFTLNGVVSTRRCANRDGVCKSGMVFIYLSQMNERQQQMFQFVWNSIKMAKS